MKTSKLFLFGTLVLALFMVVPAMAAAPPLNGNVETDFVGPGILIIEDPGGKDVGVFGQPDPPGNGSGWDIKDLRLTYDAASDTLYVGVNSYNIVGDADGDGDPNAATWGGGIDRPFLGGSETIAVYFDLDMEKDPNTFDNDKAWDVIVGVGAGDTINAFRMTVWDANEAFSPPINFTPTPLPGHIVTHSGNPDVDLPNSINRPDLEFSITNWSQLPATLDAVLSAGFTDPSPTAFRVGAFLGSQDDGSIGEDFIYYHQLPSTKVTITSDPNVGSPVDLTITEKNDSPDAIRGQILGPDGVTQDVNVQFRDVVVDVNMNGSPLPPLMAPEDSGDTSDTNVLNQGETWSWAINGVVITEFTTFVAYGSGVDALGLVHNFLGDADEVNSVDVNLPQEPNIAVEKTVDCEETIAGYPVYYTICIQNTGPVPVTVESVFDDKLGDLTAAFKAECPTLAPDANCCLEFGPYDQDDLVDPNVNTVTFDANDLSGTAAPTATDTATVDLVEPSFTVSKTCLTDPVVEGEPASFRILITNTGDVDLIIDTDEPLIGLDVPLPSGGAPIDVNIAIQVPVGAAEVCNEITVTATIDTPLNPCIDGEVLPPQDANDCCAIPGLEGCTPGFWKNNAVNWNHSAWCDAYEPDDDFNTVFGIPEQVLNANGKKTYNNPTLLQALDANGGGINALARHAVAALLNACSECVNYPTDDPQEIIDAVQDAVAAGPEAIQDLHELLAFFNEAGCPVNQHGECVGVEVEI